MNLQFADLNNDGYNDIITATFEGTAMVVYGSENGWKPQEYLRDTQDRKVVLSWYHDAEEDGFVTVDRSPEGQEHGKRDQCISATAFDWDNDGDLDLLLNPYKAGRLYLRRNLGSASNPKFEDVNHLLQAGGKDFVIPGGLTAVRLYDWDNDGDKDFLCGSFKGGLYLVENIGAKGANKLAAPVKLLDNKIEINGKTVESINWYADPVDYDNDGKIDLLVGMHVSKPIVKRELTKAEEAEYEQAQARMMELGKIIQKHLMPMRGLSKKESQAARKKLEENEEFKKTREEMESLMERALELRPREQQTASVWLFKGK